MKRQTTAHIQRLLLGLAAALLTISAPASAQVLTDPNFGTGGDTSANGAIEVIVTQSDGKILVGGKFSQIGGQSQGLSKT